MVDFWVQVVSFLFGWPRAAIQTVYEYLISLGFGLGCVLLLMLPMGCGTELTGQVLAAHILTHDEAVAGVDGIHCYDLNENGVADDDEDTNQDGIVSALDCVGSPGTNGEDGVDGVDGTNGLDGRNGQDGVDGDAGRDGRDGVDTGEGNGGHQPPGNPDQPTGPGSGHGGAA